MGDIAGCDLLTVSPESLSKLQAAEGIRLFHMDAQKLAQDVADHPSPLRAV